MEEAVSATKNHTSGKVGHKLFHILYPSWCVLSDYNEHDDQEVKIRNFEGKLLKQVHGQEGQDGVLRGADYIVFNVPTFPKSRQGLIT